MDLSGIKWQHGRWVSLIHISIEAISQIHWGFPGFLQFFSKVFQHSYSNNIITLSPDLSRFSSSFRTLHRGMARRSAVVKHAFWPIWPSSAPESFRFTTPVLWQQKNGETAAPQNGSQCHSWSLGATGDWAVTVDPMLLATSKKCWKLKRNNLWNQRGPVIPKDFQCAGDWCSTSKSKEGAKKNVKELKKLTMLCKFGGLESLRFVSFASGFHLGGPASQGSGWHIRQLMDKIVRTWHSIHFSEQW